MINLYQLQIFVTVSERGSFSAAAEELKLTQPGVSQHIKLLEQAYKVRLFNRNGPHIDLTEAGHRLLESARQLLQQAEQLDEVFSAELGEIRGKLFMAYSKSSTLALFMLPQLLHPFHQKYPGVRYNFVQIGEEEAINRLLDREAHFALLANPTRHRSLESVRLFADELALVLPPDHPWNGQQVGLKELKGLPFLLRMPGSETRRQSELALRLVGLTFNDLQVIAEMDSPEAIILAAQAGLGIGFASRAIVDRFAYKDKIGVAQILLSAQEKANGVNLMREVHLARLVTASVGERAPSQERFWEFARQQTASATEKAIT